MAKQKQQTVLEMIFLGIGRGIWWLIKLPFTGLKRKAKLSVADQQYLISKRNEILSLLSSENQLELRHAVMEADKLADWILKKKGYVGETFADRLRSAEKDIPKESYNNIWQGHKIRNQIAHENAEISHQTLRVAIKNILSING
ncbi:MAG: hypothetical protein WC451_02090 [Patescibacteria group bacterium]|jgi:hypothetical protein